MLEKIDEFIKEKSPAGYRAPNRDCRKSRAHANKISGDSPIPKGRAKPDQKGVQGERLPHGLFWRRSLSRRKNSPSGLQLSLRIGSPSTKEA